MNRLIGEQTVVLLKPLWTLIKGVFMAVQEQTPYIEYVANGETVSFPITFYFNENTPVIVSLNDVVSVYGVEWSIEDQYVKFKNTPIKNSSIKIWRATASTRSVDYKSYDNSFRPEVVNKDFDRVWWKVQEIGVSNWLDRKHTDYLNQEQRIYIDTNNKELSDRIQKFRDDVSLTAMEQTLDQAQSILDDTSNLANQVQNNTNQSQNLLNSTTQQAVNSANSANAASVAKTNAEQAVVDARAINNTTTQALYSFQNGAVKVYATLALANADIANITLNTKVSVLSVAEGGDYYKATASSTSLTKSPYDALEQSKTNTKQEINTNNEKINNEFLSKHFAENDELLLAITDAEGNKTWIQVNREDGLPSPQTISVLHDINKLVLLDGEAQISSGEKIGIALRDSEGNLTALTVRKEDGMFPDAVIENIKQRLNIVVPEVDVPDDFRAYDTTPNLNFFKSISAGVVRYINKVALPSTPYDFIDSLGQGARIYLPTNYNDGTPIPLVMVFDGVSSGSGGSNAPTVRSQFTSVLLANGIAICKSQAHGNSYGNANCMQSYLEVFQKACEIAPIGAVILMGNSMGGIAAQNALLTNAIPNISGLYLTDPTYDLRQRYDGGRKTEITSAYNIALDGSDYLEKTKGYDPALRHWSHYRSIPIFIRASSGDTNVVLSKHGQKLKEYLSDHNDVTLINTNTDGHNIADRFNGEELLSFIKKCTKLV